MVGTNKEKIVMDLEISPNYYLVGFKRLSDGKKLSFDTQTALTKEQKKTLKGVLKKYQVITFNGLRYDLPMMMLSVMDGVTVTDLFKASQVIIGENLPTFMTMNRFDIEPIDIDHIDISEPSPAVFVSLKGYGARLHSTKLQDLPYAYDKFLTEAEIIEMKLYNENDLDTTIDLYRAIEDRIDLRVEMSKQYGQDLRSKSDAQIAEAVIVKELSRAGVKATKPQMPKAVKYTPPPCIEFESPILQGLLQRVSTESFKINPKNGQPILPDWLKKFPLTIGDTKYQVGVGGLHSKEKKLVVIPKDDEVLRNIDVASYYPSMILEFGFYPKRLTAKFLDVYGKIYTTRLKAKAKESELKIDIQHILNAYEETHEQITVIVPALRRDLAKVKAVNGGLKICLNGSFGKLGSMYSKLYAPDLMLQVTLTGQLMLLMLIEQLERAGMSVKSSNTDGVEIICPKSKEAQLETIVFDWELSTGMVMEHGSYNALYAREVNNYVAVYDDEVKAKGVYAEPTLSKNSEYPIVFVAVKEYLFSGKRMEDTLLECKDITQFLTARTVRGGGVWNEQFLGKVVRWYYAFDGNSIHYATNNNKVPKSDGAYPKMDLSEGLNVGGIPPNLDHYKYVELAIKHLADLGVEYKRKM